MNLSQLSLPGETVVLRGVGVLTLMEARDCCLRMAVDCKLMKYIFWNNSVFPPTVVVLWPLKLIKTTGSLSASLHETLTNIFDNKDWTNNSGWGEEIGGGWQTISHFYSRYSSFMNYSLRPSALLLRSIAPCSIAWKKRKYFLQKKREISGVYCAVHILY